MLWEIPQALLRRDKAEAAKLVRHYQGLFGEDFYLEIVRNGIKEQEQVNAELLLLSEEPRVPLVAGTCSLRHSGGRWRARGADVRPNGAGAPDA